MITRIRLDSCLLACAVVATSSALVVDETFAQTTTEASPSRERLAEAMVGRDWWPVQTASPQGAARVGEVGNSAAYVPPTAGERLKWALDGTVGSASIASAVFIASWNTAWNTPSEWDTSWSGFGKRLGTHEARAAISNTVESGLGAAWGEDPRYRRSGRGGIRARTGYAAKAVFVAHDRNGQLRPAWARYAGSIGSDLVASTWLPASDRTALGGVRRIGNGFLGRFVGNLWMEFWPDVRRRLAEDK